MFAVVIVFSAMTAAAQKSAIVSDSVTSAVAAAGGVRTAAVEANRLLAEAVLSLGRPSVGDRQVAEDSAVPLIRWLDAIGVDSFPDLESALDLFSWVVTQSAGDLARAGYHESAILIRRRIPMLRDKEIITRWASAVAAGREVVILENSISLLGVARATGGTSRNASGNATLVFRRPAGTEILVAGTVRGAAPTEVSVPAGDVEVAFRSESHLFPGQIVSVQTDDRLLLQPTGAPAGTTRVDGTLPTGRLVVLENGEEEVFLSGDRTATLPPGEYRARVLSTGSRPTSASIGSVTIAEGVVSPVDAVSTSAVAGATLRHAPEDLTFSNRAHTVDQTPEGNRIVTPGISTADALVGTFPIGSERASIVIPLAGTGSAQSVDLAPFDVEIGPLPVFSKLRIAGIEIASIDGDGDNVRIINNEDAKTWSALVTLPRSSFIATFTGPTHEPLSLGVTPPLPGEDTVALVPDLNPRPAIEVQLSLADRRAVLPNTQYYIRLSSAGESTGAASASAEWTGTVDGGFVPLVTSLPAEEVHLVVGFADDPNPTFEELLEVDAGEMRVVPVGLRYSNENLLGRLNARQEELNRELEQPMERRRRQVRRTRIWGGITVGLAVLTGVFYFNGSEHRSDYKSASTTAAQEDAYQALQEARTWSLIGSLATLGTGAITLTNLVARPDIDDLEVRRDALDAEIARIQQEMGQ